MAVWSRLSDVNEKVLVVIVSYGLIEDIVSKERVSTAFGAATLKVLQKTKTIRTNTKQFCLREDIVVDGQQYAQKRRITFDLIKKVPQLIDGLFMRHWDKEEDIEQLAAINQSLTRFEYDMFNEQPLAPLGIVEIFRIDNNVVTYVKAVKEINRCYTGENVDFEFPPSVQMSRLVAKYPDLKIKIKTQSSQVNDELFRMCYHYYVSLELDPSESFEHIRRVTIDELRDQYEDLRLLTNLEHLEVLGEPWQIIQMYPFIVSKLKRVYWWVEKWPKKYVKVVKRLINTHPLESLILKWDSGKEEIIQTILNSPMNTLKNVRLAIDDFSPIRDTHPYSVVGAIFEFTPESESDLDIMKRTLVKFPNIRVVKVFRGNAFLEKVKDLCREFECSNRRRSIKVVEIADRRYRRRR